MTIKGILQELRDDNIIDSDKIGLPLVPPTFYLIGKYTFLGASVYFWSFPSKRVVSKT